MQTVKSITQLKESLKELRSDGSKIGLVPTMGALHAGHLALIREGLSKCDHIVASIFVNPTQFGENEDLDTYPRQLEEDTAMLLSEGVSLLWAPPVHEMYPASFSTTISVNRYSSGFCGIHRPGHFDGVATIVCKLFNQVEPDIAFFGEKDFQQLVVIRSMARDLNLSRPTADKILGIPTVREEDGLAMSSRNRYLSREDRKSASILPKAMRLAVEKIENRGCPSEALEELRNSLLHGGFTSVDYIALADSNSLERINSSPVSPSRLLVAAQIGGTRLIDNMKVELKE